MSPLVFWAAVACLAVFAAWVVAMPLLRPRTGADPRTHALAVYRDQLAEVDRDRERGLIGEDEAVAARIEIQRRALHTARETMATSSGERRRPATALGLALGLAVASLAVYAVIGSPGMPGQPLASRNLDELREEREQAAAMLAGLEERAASETAPHEAQFWFSLGRLRGDLIGPAEAARAYREGLVRNPQSALLMTALGEALVQQAQGTVTPSARELFRGAIERERDQPQALYYLGTAAVQEGDDERALERWGQLLATAPSDASWRPAVEAQYREVAERMGQDADALLAERQGAAPLAARGDGAEREAMIRSMVDSLAARLAENPDDVDGWLRLGRSRLVLGEADPAVEAFARARALAPDNRDAVAGEAEARLAAAERVDGMPMVDGELVRVLEELATLQPENPQPHWYLGLRALQLGEIDEARASWERVLALLGSDNPSYGVVKQQIDALPESGG